MTFRLIHIPYNFYISIVLFVATAGLSSCMTVSAFLNSSDDSTKIGQGMHDIVDSAGRCKNSQHRASVLAAEGHQKIISGMSECDVVALYGIPQGLLIGINADGRRRVEMVYEEPEGKIRRLIFLANRLTGQRPTLGANLRQKLQE